MNLPSSEKCCGCAACHAVCPAGAIKMAQDKDGFMQPNVDAAKCIDCRRCINVCPVNGAKNTPQMINCYIAKSASQDIVLNSSSGGVFSELALPVLHANGAVVGCVMDALGKKVFHQLITKAESLPLMMGSKYVQSEMCDIYNQAKNHLDKGLPLLFSGTPCHIQAFKRFLNRDYENLLCVEIVCHGVGSAKIFWQFVNELERQYGGKAEKLYFRDKHVVSGKSSFVAEFTGSNVKFVSPSYDNPYGKAFMSRLCLRLSCDNCGSKHGVSGADITIGDYWGGDRFHPEFAQGQGASVVVAWTPKGCNAISNANLIIAPSLWGYAITYNPSLYRSGRRDNNASRLFFEKCQTLTVRESVSSVVGGAEVLCFAKRVISAIARRLQQATGGRANIPDEANYGRVGIKTVSRSLLLNNYGSFFQHLALRHVISSFGYTPFRLADDDSLWKEVFDWLMPLRAVRLRIKQALGLHAQPVDYVSARSICTRFAFIRDYKRFMGALFEKDSKSVYAYVAGGDSIWSSHDPASFLLDKPYNVPRLSYAASAAWDIAMKSEEWRKCVDEVGHTYAAISVREQYGVDQIEAICPGVLISKVVDPVFYLNPSVLAGFASKKKVCRGRTLFVYLVNVYSKGDINLGALEGVADQMGATLKILGIQNSDKYIPAKYRVNASPSRFLRYVFDADYVLTNSFHGLVFSLILHKNFIFVEQRCVRYGNHNLRQHELLQTYHLSHRILPVNYSKDDAANIITQPINWDAVQQKLDLNIASSREWLKSNLDMAATRNVR